MARINLKAPHAVYVVRAPGGEVLYVGMSGNLRARLAVHRCSTEWWSDDLEVAHEMLPDHWKAKRHEARLILKLCPRHNQINYEIWYDRAEEMCALRCRGLTIAEIRELTGIPGETLTRVLNRVGCYPPKPGQPDLRPAWHRDQFARFT